MARPLKPLVRGGGYYPSNLVTPLVYRGGYTAAQGGGENPLPDDYEQVNGFAFDSDCYFAITGLKLKGSDTVQFSMIPRAACNVFGCYTTTDATDNYSLYVSTANNAKYLRYNGGTYKSKFASADLGKRYDISITPTGSHGFPEGQDDTWIEAAFEAQVDMCIGTTATNASSAKFKGDIIGAFTVDGRFNGIPCKRKADDVLGYYDTVTGTFFEPSYGAPTVVESE